MKKSLNSALLRFLMMGMVLVSIIFTACENFLDGAVLKKSVEKEIEWEKAESLSVLVTPEEGTGSTVPFGNYDCKLGYFFEVSFTENNSYSFIKWAAVSADNLSEEIEGVLFEDASSPKTTVKFARPISNVRILPVCTQRIAVSGEPSPRYEPNGVARDRSISVTFTKELSEENFIFQPEELPQGAAAQTDDDGKIWAYVLGNQTFLKNISITNADDFSIAEHFSRPQVTGRLLTIPVDKTKPIQFNTGEVFKTIKVSLSKEISDSDNIKMNYSKSWNYLITEATDEKATVNLSGNSSEGSVYLAGTKDYSLGQKITLAFTENADYQFIRWDYDSSIIYIEDPKNINTTALVLEKTTEESPTQIKAVCAPRLRVTSFSPVNDSTKPSASKNSSVVITFNHNLPTDEAGLAQLQNLMITVGGSPVKSSFNAPVINAATVTFSADESNMLEVAAGQTKTVTVSIPADFYYLLDDCTKITYGGNGKSFDYKINETTLQQAEITFTASANSGSLTGVSGTNSYSLGQELELEFVPANNYQFNGWTITRGAEEVSESEIKILDKSALKTKLIVYKELKGVTVTAKASEKLTLTGTPSSGINPKDSKIELIFNKAIPAECDSLLGSIKVRMNGSTVENYFTPSHTTANPEKITLTNTKYLDVGTNETKLISVIVPVDFYYIDGNVKVYLEKEYSFDYEVSSSTNSKTDITFKLADGDSGEIIPASDSYDIGKVIDLKFNPQRGYRFTGWNISAGGLAVSEEKIKIEDKTAANTKLYIYDKVSNVQVTADAYLVPAITGISPEYASTGCDQDSTIKITFNKPMDVSSFNFTDVNSVSIRTASGDELFPAGGYYETPEFSDNNTVLKIPTVKGKFILPVDSPATKDLTICLNNIKDSEGYLLNDSGSYAYTYRVNEKKDNEKPVIKDIHLYSTSDTTDYFYKELTNKSFEQWSSEIVNRENGMALYQNGDFSRNHVSHLYITLKAYDKDSGLKEVRIKETYKRDTSNNTVTEQSYTKFYSAGNFETAKDSEGNTVHDCKIEYDFAAENPNDGLYLIEVSLVDMANNEKTVEYWVIKDTYNSLGKGKVIVASVEGVNSDWTDAVEKYIPNYNSQTGQYEVGFPLSRFIIVDDSYYAAYKSHRFLILNFYDEGGECTTVLNEDIGLESNIVSKVNAALNGKTRNPEKTGVFDITINEESGLVGNYKILIPKSTQITYFKNYDACIGDSEYVLDSGTGGLEYKVFYTYQENKESLPGKMTYLNSGTYLKNFVQGTGFQDGIYNLYILRDIPYGAADRLYGSFGKSYTYYKGVANPYENNKPSDLIFPDFTLPTEDKIIYEKNTGMAKFNIDVTFPNNKYNYYLIVDDKCFSSGNDIEVSNGSGVYVYLIAQDENGNFIAETAKKYLNLQKVDNIPPSISTVGNDNKKSFIDSEKIRFWAIPYDLNEKKQMVRNISEVDCYFVPYNYGSAINDLTFLDSGIFKKQKCKITRSDYFEIPFDGLNDGQYFIYFNLIDSSALKNSKLFRAYDIVYNEISTNIPAASGSKENNEYKINISLPNYYSAIGSKTFEHCYFSIKSLENENWTDSTIINKRIEKSDNKYEFSFTNDFSEKFIKINSKYSEAGNYLLAYAKPLYIYPDYYKYLYDYAAEHPGETAPAYCKSKTWLQTANGWQIFSDKPCFVHTRWCSKNLTAAGNLSRDAAYEWEARAQEAGIVYNDGSSTTFSYTNDNLAEVPGGAYYTTICHFADGTVLMSEVKQK